MQAAQPSTAAGLCPRCDAPRAADQGYCLDCGLPLPPATGPTAAFRRFWVRWFGWYPGDWALVGFVALLIAAAGAAGAVVLSQREDNGGSTFAASTPPAAAPVAKRQRTSTVAARGRGKPATAPIEWPAGERGWTVVLLSLPRSAGADAAAARAARAAKAGLPDAGVLVSDRFASLHPGYFVIFTGVYASEAEAQAAVPTARSRGFGGAYARPIVP